MSTLGDPTHYPSSLAHVSDISEPPALPSPCRLILPASFPPPRPSYLQRFDAQLDALGKDIDTLIKTQNIINASILNDYNLLTAIQESLKKTCNPLEFQRLAAEDRAVRERFAQHKRDLADFVYDWGRFKSRWDHLMGIIPEPKLPWDW